MSWLEEMAISVLLGALQQFVKNPAKKEAMKKVLLDIAGEIYMEYGLTPPAPPTTAA